MKKLAMLLSLVFVAGVAVAEEAKKPEAGAAPAAATADAAKPADAANPTDAKAAKAAKAAEKLAGKTHEVAAEVVSVDADKNTLTIKGESGDKTVPVDTKAAASLKDVKAGDKVTLTCWDDAAGAHQKVVAIAKK
jgi:hypothetical protein